MGRRLVIVKILLVIFLGLSSNSQSQTEIANWNKTGLPDTVRIQSAIKLIMQIKDLDTSLYYLQEIYDFAESKDLVKWQGHALFHKGKKLLQHQLFNGALSALLHAEELYRTIGYNRGLATAKLARGNVMREKGNYKEAQELYLSSLKLNEKMNDSSGISLVKFNLGNLFHLIDQPKEALKYFQEAKTIDSLLGDQWSYISDLTNIGGTYHQMKQYNKAREYYTLASQMHLELEDFMGYAALMSNIGLLCTDEGKDEEALTWYDKAMKIHRENGNLDGVSTVWRNIGSAYFNLNQYNLALDACEKSLEISTRASLPDVVLEACDCLREVYVKTGDYRKAFEMQTRFYSIRDSLKGDENVMELTTMQLEHRFGQQMLADSITAAQRERQLKIEQEALEKEKAQKQRETMMISIGGGVIIVALGLLLFNINRSNQRKKKDNQIITKQKEEVERQKEEAEIQRELVEEKNKEILDSINYAKRLQEAILPPKKLVKEYMPNSFILYKPKDIVAGDFYWMETIDDIIYFAAADCTGHGVPGAMVSVVCSNALTKAVIEDGLRDPGKILDRARDLVIQRFSKSEEGVRDGMDISLVAMSLTASGTMNSTSLRWAGANNPLWIIRNNADNVEEYKADKQPIGNYEDAKPFTTHAVTLNQGDSLYIFSDGFQDQFGGEKGKKYKSANLKEFLLKICKFSHEEQRRLLIDEFTNWKGSIEQIDDVCIIGLTV